MRDFLKKFEGGLEGKTIAVTGATGGIGEHLCLAILKLGGRLIMLGRNEQKLNALKEKIGSEAKTKIEIIVADMENTDSVFLAAEQIKKLGTNMIIHNAGAYKIPRRKTKTGFNNVFIINCISPYILTREIMNDLERVVVVGSIAHNYSKTDENDIDFNSRRASSLVYGNAKRYLMYSHFELLKNSKTQLSVTHPGITLTGITAHYPEWLYVLIKPLMKVLFMKPRFAALSILYGLFESTGPYNWIGPRIFGIWGAPEKTKLKTADNQEIEKIAKKTEEIYDFVKNMQKNS